ncbi:PREDICTED: uncharacterized protein LOC109230255 [Nicotiana attenuata]|uniref:uncharacterized protein LOC109230255 n=1 Tax=Nicotiana attenuata TaxID=49451 RepID=UPI0009056290|nr:PREDICTED: uncharacterized protein LOC109230255 [Nicotiana attenuata]
MKIRGALKKKANVALISQIEPKKVDEALKDSNWLTKALYGLKQAPRAWYERLSSFLLDHGFTREFVGLMQSEFEMSMMGELTFFLGLPIQQSKEGTFVYHMIYTKELVQKFGMSSAKAIGMPMSSSTNLDKDKKGNPVDETKYRGMIGSLIYLTASRPDIMFSLCKYARFSQLLRNRI